MVALLGSAVILALTGLGMAVTYGLIVSDFSRVPELVGAALSYLPAVWVLVGTALLLYGFIPRAVSVVWAVYAWCCCPGCWATCSTCRPGCTGSPRSSMSRRSRQTISKCCRCCCSLRSRRR